MANPSGNVQIMYDQDSDFLISNQNYRHVSAIKSRVNKEAVPCWIFIWS